MTLRGDVLIRGTPKIFRYLRGEKATRGSFNFKWGVKAQPETMIELPLPLNHSWVSTFL